MKNRRVWGGEEGFNGLCRGPVGRGLRGGGADERGYGGQSWVGPRTGFEHLLRRCDPRW